jgi:hypothetical protein
VPSSFRLAEHSPTKSAASRLATSRTRPLRLRAKVLALAAAGPAWDANFTLIMPKNQAIMTKLDMHGARAIPVP